MTVTVSGKKEVTSVKIAPEAVDPDDVEMLEAVGSGILMENAPEELKSGFPRRQRIMSMTGFMRRL